MLAFRATSTWFVAPVHALTAKNGVENVGLYPSRMVSPSRETQTSESSRETAMFKNSADSSALGSFHHSVAIGSLKKVKEFVQGVSSIQGAMKGTKISSNQQDEV